MGAHGEESRELGSWNLTILIIFFFFFGKTILKSSLANDAEYGKITSWNLFTTL